MAKKKKPAPAPAPGQKTLTSFFAGKAGQGSKGSKGTMQKGEKGEKGEKRVASPSRAVPDSPVVLGAQVKTEHPNNESQFISGTVTAVTPGDGGASTYRVEFDGCDAPKVAHWTYQQAVQGQLFAHAIGRKVCKDFGGQWFHGEVTLVWKDDNGALQFRILYEDGDSEDMDEATYKRWRSDDDTTKGKGRSASPVASSIHIDDQENAQPVKEKQTNVEKRKRLSASTTQAFKKRGGASKKPDDDDDGTSGAPLALSVSRSRRTRKAPVSYSEDTDFESDEDEEDLSFESEDEESTPMEEPMDVDDTDDEIFTKTLPKTTKKRIPAEPKAVPTITKSVVSTKKTSTGNKNDVSDAREDKLEKLHAKMAAEQKDLKPQNNPQVMPEKPFVDPVGIDPTHGIIEGIISEQVRKVGGLLKCVAERNEKGLMEKGELPFPIKLQTACSGTDAPSIALSLIQETLDHLYRDKSEINHGFSFSHEMSCEIEPFKQAYIGRNFPGVPLFPDITKLTVEDQVTDVYGRSQTIPKGNLFVAGTSCKDFSMLKSNLRLDIEDKGTSGQTFLAAVEFLEKFEPEFFIFENVDGAPWDKMQEYITGRIQLSRRDDTTAITSSKTKADACSQLKFSVGKDGSYVAEEVPRQVGIRAGTTVQGFVRVGDNYNNVHPLESKAKVGSIFTLGQLATSHNINLDQDILVMEKKTRYCTNLCKLDTKEYGLPQTRNRKYLFGWKSNDPDDDLGIYIDILMEHLKTPLLYPMDAFLLPDTHDRIRCFREALRSGPGLMVKRERATELDFWDWELSQNLDTPRHMVYRQIYGIEERSRWLTQWDTRGRKRLPPSCWSELFDCWNMRRLDLIDCFATAAVRDVISRDPLHHSFVWDLSQNVTRTQYRTATVGVSGCVTPGGELFLPHRGRTLMGYEKLLLQGIPFSRLRLGHESEVQISDLAGNAMSVSVISATLLAALCAPELRRQQKNINNLTFGKLLTDYRTLKMSCQAQNVKKEEAKHKQKMAKIFETIRNHASSLLKNFRLSQKHDETGGRVIPERGDLHGRIDMGGTSSCSFTNTLRALARDFAEESYLSSVLCTCESSGVKTKEVMILECIDCGMSICHQCSDRHQTESHNLRADIKGNVIRPEPHVFENRLRCAVPSLLRLGHGWCDAVSDAEGLELAYGFQLQQIDRKRGFWELVYGAWEDFGSGRQVAEIRVRLGRTGTLYHFGAIAYLRCFARSIQHHEPYRGNLAFHARLIVDASTENSSWEIVSPEISRATLRLAGRGRCPSHRVQVGLTDVACSSFEKHNVKSAFLPKVHSRNSLTTYHEKWKQWPNEIEISGASMLDGTYCRLPCRHTVVHSALWRRESSGEEPALYILIRPDIVRSGLDTAVISRTPSYNDIMEVCELLDWIPENALESDTETTIANLIRWTPRPELQVDVLSPIIALSSQNQSFHDTVSRASAENSESVLCRLTGLPGALVERLVEYSASKGDAKSVIDVYGKFGTRNAKRLSLVAAPSLQKYAASNSLPLNFSQWYTLPLHWSFAQSEVHVPKRPVERWKVPIKRGKDVVYERYYDPVESHRYYQNLLKRPSPFCITVDRLQGELIISMNPSVAAYNAVARLGGEKSKRATVEYCLAELSSMGEPGTKEFKVPNSDAYEETTVSGLTLPLYTRQSKALARMIAIERGDVLFAEEERSEHILPGVGWCLSAKATTSRALKGGVLGDAIGSGKTVITIALILQGIQKARKDRDVHRGKSGASLVVVPPGLVQQWDDERRKFTGNQLSCIKIQCVDDLKRCTVKHLCEADMIIVPAGIIEEAPKPGPRRPYTEHLVLKAGLALEDGKGLIPPAPTYYSQREAPTIEGTWVRNMASGPDIYVGNHGSQRKRDAQAYYTRCYHEAIATLRTKEFGASEKGVPLEYFHWERVIIDECHETLVTGKSQEVTNEDFKEKARRGAREFLGVAQTDPAKRPLVATRGVWGLTGTPLLETEARVTELANLMGGTYLTGACHHWRKEERESGRDLFLNQQEGSYSREYRCAIQSACHAYVKQACQRNRGETLRVRLTLAQLPVNMSAEEGEKFKQRISNLQLSSYSISADQLGDKVSSVLPLSAKSKARYTALKEVIDSILKEEPETKIVVFANKSWGGYEGALGALTACNKEFCHLSDDCTVRQQNEIISWFRHVDATEEDRARPRVLLLSFEQAAGHNLQEACHHVVLYDPMYSGTDAVADASVEEQAVGRVMRQGQTSDVTVTRIVVKGPDGERCLDDWIIDRNSDENVLRAATSNFD